MHRLLIAVTGTPGTGKSAFAKRLAAVVEGSSLVEINDVVDKNELYSGTDRFGTRIVKLGRLNSIFSKELKNRRRPVIVVGHLAPELRLRYDIAVVLRCGLKKLSGRLEKREYPKEKIAENLVSEALDYCGSKIIKRAAETYEVETAEEQKAVMDYIVSVSEGRSARRPGQREINKLGDLFSMVRRGNRYGL